MHRMMTRYGWRCSNRDTSHQPSWSRPRDYRFTNLSTVFLITQVRLIRLARLARRKIIRGEPRRCAYAHRIARTMTPGATKAGYTRTNVYMCASITQVRVRASPSPSPSRAWLKMIVPARAWSTRSLKSSTSLLWAAHRSPFLPQRRNSLLHLETYERNSFLRRAIPRAPPAAKILRAESVIGESPWNSVS